MFIKQLSFAEIQDKMNLRARILGKVAVAGLAAILAASGCGGGDSRFVLKGNVVNERYIPGVHYFTLKDNTHGNVEIGMSQTAMPALVSSLDRYSEKELGNNILARAKNLVDNGEYASIPDAVDSIINPGVSIEVRFDAAPPSGSLYYNADNMFLAKSGK